MPLLRPRDQRNPRPIRAYAFLRCPMNGHQVSWCRQLCEPTGGLGQCGRAAPHDLLGRTQLAIAAYEANQKP